MHIQRKWSRILGIKVIIDDVHQLEDGIWIADLPAHEIQTFGHCPSKEGNVSIVLLKSGKFIPKNNQLIVGLDDLVPLNIGSSFKTILIDPVDEKAKSDAEQKQIEKGYYGSGDLEFLQKLELYVGELEEIGKKLLKGVRSRFPGDLNKGKRLNFTNRPDNFWYLIIQPRKKNLSITVRGEPERFATRKLKLISDRSSYTRFFLDNENDVDEAVEIIAQAKRKF